MNISLGNRSEIPATFDGRVNKGTGTPIMEHPPQAQIHDTDHKMALFLTLTELDSLLAVLGALRSELLDAEAEWLARDTNAVSA